MTDNDVNVDIDVSYPDNISDAQREMYDLLADLSAEQLETFVDKNISYGNSWIFSGVEAADVGTKYDSYQEAVAEGLMFRTSDKRQRLRNILDNPENERVGEAGPETAGDNSVYWLMFSALLEDPDTVLANAFENTPDRPDGSSDSDLELHIHGRDGEERTFPVTEMSVESSLYPGAETINEYVDAEDMLDEEDEDLRADGWTLNKASYSGEFSHSGPHYGTVDKLPEYETTAPNPTTGSSHWTLEDHMRHAPRHEGDEELDVDALLDELGVGFGDDIYTGDISDLYPVDPLLDKKLDEAFEELPDDASVSDVLSAAESVIDEWVEMDERSKTLDNVLYGQSKRASRPSHFKNQEGSIRASDEFLFVVNGKVPASEVVDFLSTMTMFDRDAAVNMLQELEGQGSVQFEQGDTEWVEVLENRTVPVPVEGLAIDHVRFYVAQPGGLV